MLQLNPPIPLDTPKGKGFAHFVIDYGQEFHLLFVTFIDATGECWTFQNPEIRLQQPNSSMGRPMPNAKQANKTTVGKKVSASEMGARLRVGLKKGDGAPKSENGKRDMAPSKTKSGRSGQKFK